MPEAATLHAALHDDIAHTLARDLNFPTCLDAAVMIRNALRDPLASVERVARVVALEPLVSSKLLRLANTVVFNPGGQAVTDIATAVSRLGFEVVRMTSLAVAMDQIRQAQPLGDFRPLAHAAWQHSVDVAAIARALARRVGHIDPEAAMLAGLVHDIGVFYVLYRAAEFPEFHADPAALHELLAVTHESVGERLIYALGLPKNIVEAIHDPDHPRRIEEPRTLGDVVYFANQLAGGEQPWTEPTPEERAALEADRGRYADLLADIQDEIGELHAALQHS